MSEHPSDLHREFELERLILFSDAVFAIAITLVIIEIKFPDVPKDATSTQILYAFKPTIIQFAAFCLSFLFIGTSWIRHLEICRHLIRFDKGLIKRNLFFLFFIVCFPFSASGITEHIRPGFMLPLFIYFINITLVSIMQYALCHYAFIKKNSLSANGFEAQKKYLFLLCKWTSIILSVTVVVYGTLSYFFNQETLIPSYSIYVFAILMFVMRRKIKKYKPVSDEIM